MLLKTKSSQDFYACVASDIFTIESFYHRFIFRVV